MRPHKFRRAVDDAILHRLQTGSNAKFTPRLIHRMEREWRRLSALEEDYRKGTETYGYDGDVRYDLMYISDRWRCSFRLRWLLDGLEANKI